MDYHHKIDDDFGCNFDQQIEKAIKFHQRHLFDDSKKLLIRILLFHPVHTNALSLLGIILCQEGQRRAGIKLFLHSLSISPDHDIIYRNCALAYLNEKNYELSYTMAIKACILKPQMSVYFYELAVIKKNLGHTHSALQSCFYAQLLDPYNLTLYDLWAQLYFDLHLYREALIAIKKAFILSPSHQQIITNLAVIAVQLDDEKLACDCYLKLCSIIPDYSDSFLGLGNFYATKKFNDLAIVFWKKAIILNPTNYAAFYNLSLVLITLGHFQEAWRGFDWRWPCGFDRQAPRWRGQWGKGQRLLIHCDGGFGDAIQFCRFIPLAAERGWRVTLMAPYPLLKLFETLQGVDQLIELTENFTQFDRHSPIMSLPFAVGITPQTLSYGAYLHSDDHQKEKWYKKINERCSDQKSLKVGLVLSGSSYPRHSESFKEMNQRRSIPPKLFEPLLECSGIHFFSLQKESPIRPQDFPVIDFMRGIDNFAETAGLISQLDLVIAVDTAVAHLSGALGKTTWLLNRYDSCWRWPIEGERTAWYPSFRIFKQIQQGDWSFVIQQLRKALNDLIDQRNNQG